MKWTVILTALQLHYVNEPTYEKSCLQHPSQPNLPSGFTDQLHSDRSQMTLERTAEERRLPACLPAVNEQKMMIK